MHIKTSYVFAIIVKAINAEFAGNKVKMLKFNITETFPTLLSFTYGFPVDAPKALSKTKRGLNLVA